MALNLVRDDDQRSPEQASRKPFWRRPWVGPLAVAVVAYLYLASQPFLGVPKSQAPLQPHEGFALYYPLLITHMVAGSVAMVTMVLQVWPWLREQHPAVHRVSGRVYTVGVLVSSLLGLVVVWWAPQPGKVGALCLLVFWLATTVAGYRAARLGNIGKHRRYMLYSFAVSASNWPFFVLLLLVQFQVPFDIAYYQEAARWVPWVGNVMLVQWWLYRTARRQRASAGVSAPLRSVSSPRDREFVNTVDVHVGPQGNLAGGDGQFQRREAA